MKRYVLMNPGPACVTERVRDALKTVDLCHREVEYFECQNDVRRLLLDVFQLDPERYAAILLTGSGSAAMEAAMSSAFAPGAGVLVINNGVYGDRLAKMARAHSVDVTELVFEWTERPDLGAMAAALDANPSISAVAIVHHETTTGLLNPIEAVAQLVRERGLEFIVDSVSGLAGEHFDFETIRPTYVICTANKCIQGFPGIAFVLAERAAVERAAAYPARSLYLNLPNYLAKQDASNTPFTPAVQVMFALREALLELEEETVNGRVARYTRASAILRAGFEKLGLPFLLRAEHRSNTITTVELPGRLTYPELHDALKEVGYVIYSGQGDLGKTHFRVANMGQITEDELHRFVREFETMLAPHVTGAA